MFLLQSISSTLLALSFLLNSAYGEDEREVIAYRTALGDEAKWINRNNKLYRAEKLDSPWEPFKQIGKGYYAVHEPGDWNDENEPDLWYCVIEANMTKIREVGKIWIPEAYEWSGALTALWTTMRGNEGAVMEYIVSQQEQGVVPDAKKALRFAPVVIAPGKMQMVIPTATINNNDLDISAQCWKEEEELLEYSSKAVDWLSWDIAGKPTSNTQRLDNWNPRWYKRMLRGWLKWEEPLFEFQLPEILPKAAPAA
ncbi:hypothetical protein LZ554_000305 [Drepanopeziza brunnea f. sp. 'monogermtubi']|nr:hypothetical protein LZ554_000305 [Drepanopeziza brunnea f. sp. 'monogermtubi']